MQKSYRYKWIVSNPKDKYSDTEATDIRFFLFLSLEFKVVGKDIHSYLPSHQVTIQAQYYYLVSVFL